MSGNYSNMLFDCIEWNIKPHRYLLSVASFMLANIFQSQFLTIIYSAIYSAIYITTFIRPQRSLKPNYQTYEVKWLPLFLIQMPNRFTFPFPGTILKRDFLYNLDNWKRTVM